MELNRTLLGLHYSCLTNHKPHVQSMFSIGHKAANRNAERLPKARDVDTSPPRRPNLLPKQGAALGNAGYVTYTRVPTRHHVVNNKKRPAGTECAEGRPPPRTLFAKARASPPTNAGKALGRHVCIQTQTTTLPSTRPTRTSFPKGDSSLSACPPTFNQTKKDSLTTNNASYKVRHRELYCLSENSLKYHYKNNQRCHIIGFADEPQLVLRHLLSTYIYIYIERESSFQQAMNKRRRFCNVTSYSCTNT